MTNIHIAIPLAVLCKSTTDEKHGLETFGGIVIILITTKESIYNNLPGKGNLSYLYVYSLQDELSLTNSSYPI